MKDIDFKGTTENLPMTQSVQSADTSAGSAPSARSLHTDVSQLIDKGEITKVDVVLAERAQQEREALKSSSSGDDGHHLGRIIFFLTLLLAFGIGVGIYALIQPTIKLPFAKDGVADPTQQKDLSILLSNSPREQILADIAIAFQKTVLPQDASRGIQFLIGGAQGDEHTSATTTELLNRLALTPLKKDFLRSLDEGVFYRIHSSGNIVGALTLHSRSYPESFAGMLAWEPLMAEDLIPALNPEIKRSDIKALRGRQFVDERFGSVDARVLRQPGGVAVIAYAFLDKKTLIILGGTPGLSALLTELSTKQAVE